MPPAPKERKDAGGNRQRGMQFLFFVKSSAVAFDTNYSGRVLAGKFSRESFLKIVFFLSVSALNRSIVQKQVS